MGGRGKREISTDCRCHRHCGNGRADDRYRPGFRQLPGKPGRPALRFYAGGRKDRSFGNLVMTPRLSFVPRLKILGKAVAQLDPTKLAAGACVIPRWHQIRVVETARRHVDFIQAVVVLESQLSTATRAESAGRLVAGSVPSGRALQKPKLRREDTEPGHQGSARSPTADRAVAGRLIEGRTSDLVSYGATKAPTFQHRRLLDDMITYENSSGARRF